MCFGSNVSPSIFGCLFVGSVLLFIYSVMGRVVLLPSPCCRVALLPITLPVVIPTFRIINHPEKNILIFAPRPR